MKCTCSRIKESEDQREKYNYSQVALLIFRYRTTLVNLSYIPGICNTTLSSHRRPASAYCGLCRRTRSRLFDVDFRFNLSDSRASGLGEVHPAPEYDRGDGSPEEKERDPSGLLRERTVTCVLF